MATPSRFRTCATIALFLALVPAAPAAEQVDQSNVPEWGGGWTHVNPTADGQAVMWQTFTPACTNLTAVEIDILTISPGRGDDVLTVEIAGDGVVLASAERAVEDGFDGLLRFEFPEAVPLVPEQLHELKVHDTGKGHFGWKYGSNTYERGSRYVFAQERPASDWFFRTYAWVESAATKYSGGIGEPNDPYQIATAADLIALGETPEDYDKHFVLTADIDLDPNLPGCKVFDRAIVAPAAESVTASGFPFFFVETPFTGVLDGKGHTISHLTISGSAYLGLFARLDAPASVSNLGLEAVKISGTGGSIGGLVGFNGGSIASCYSTGSVSGDSDVGGLVGGNRGSITTSSSSSRVSGRNRVGGLVGENGGSITTSSSSSRVSGRDRVGGLVGQNHGSITKCHNTGSVSGVEDVGGLVGRNYSGGLNSGQIAASYNSGSVSGNNFVGGLVGTDDKGGIATSYSSGSVSGTSYVGGLVGTNNGGSIATSYSSGSVSGSERIGGLVGSCLPAQVQHSVWDTETSGLSGSIGGLGLTTAEMMDPDILSLNGFANDPNWVLDGGRDYPRLAWEGTPGQIIPEPEIDWLEGQGTLEDPYCIDTAEQLIFLGRAASALWDRHFILGRDIDLDPTLPGRTIFARAVLPVFSGVFDGGGHVISNLTVEGGSYLGLFGMLSSADVKNVAAMDVNIIGSGSYVGGLAGYSYNHTSSISESYSSGCVRGTRFVGGLVGLNNGASVTACHSDGTVAGESYVGGLLGGNSSSLGTRTWRAVSRCYSSSSVSGESCVGGLVGSAAEWGYFSYGGTLRDCYATGRVLGTQSVGGLVGEMYGGVVGCFWDTQTSGTLDGLGNVDPDPNGVAGKTTAEMQTAGTFLDAGWDFVGETANGTEDIWWILEGLDYPRLWWELDENEEPNP